jgi:uncharacterized protein (DUF433 family)
MRRKFLIKAMKHYITTDPEIMSGQPCIVGTRIPISRILHLLKQGYTVEAIHEEYDWVDLKTLKGAIDEAIAQFDVPAATHA